MATQSKQVKYAKSKIDSTVKYLDFQSNQIIDTMLDMTTAIEALDMEGLAKIIKKTLPLEDAIFRDISKRYSGETISNFPTEIAISIFKYYQTADYAYNWLSSIHNKNQKFFSKGRDIPGNN